MTESSCYQNLEGAVRGWGRLSAVLFQLEFCPSLPLLIRAEADFPRGLFCLSLSLSISAFSEVNGWGSVGQGSDRSWVKVQQRKHPLLLFVNLIFCTGAEDVLDPKPNFWAVALEGPDLVLHRRYAQYMLLDLNWRGFWPTTRGGKKKISSSCLDLFCLEILF